MNVALDVDATGYDSAADALATACSTTRTAHADLTGTLSGLAGMGGDDKSSEDWVASYDPAARDLEAAIADLGTAWGTLSAVTMTSGANHRDANAGSVIGGGGGGEGADSTADLSPLTSSPPPGALGADSEGMPDGWDLVVDHLQGWAWPSADVGKLRDAAAAWRSAAGMIGYTPADGASARSQLGNQRSPEIATAGSAISDVEQAATDIAAACNELAGACDDYATQVEQTRDTIKGLLRDLLIEVAATAAVSGLASLVTFGGAAAAGAAVAIQRAISCARRIIAALMALKGIRAVATMVRSIGKIRAVQTTLRRFRSFRNMRRKPESLKDLPKKGKPNSYGYDKNGDRLPYTNSRPKYGEGQVDDVWRRAERDGGGEVWVRDKDGNLVKVDWKPGDPRRDIWDMGHQPGQEYRKLRDEFLSGRIDYDEFMRRYRDPDNYRVENPGRNRSHVDEK